MKSSQHIQVYRSQESIKLPVMSWPTLTKKRREQLGISGRYDDLGKAADALLRRYVKGRMVGMPNVGYPNECPYIWHPPRDDSAFEVDKQLRLCIELVNQWPDLVGMIVRQQWCADKPSISKIALSMGLSTRRVSAIISTARYKVVRECIEPFTITGH